MTFTSAFISVLLISTRGIKAQLQEPIIGEAQDEASCHNAVRQ